MSRKKYLFIFIAILFALLNIFLGLFLIHLCGNEKNEVNIDGNIHHQYKLYEKDYKRNETSFGIVTLFNEIDGFVSFDDFELQKSTLISSFGTEEFECFGSCYCENENIRRISQSKILIDGISYLLAAVSSVVAINIAKEYFSEKCSEEFSNICESKSIKSEVSDCESVVQESNEEVQELKTQKRVYFCYGNCLEKKLHAINIPKAGKEQGIDCKKLKTEGEVIVYRHDLIRDGRSNLDLSTKMREMARRTFQSKTLVPFCKEKSVVEFEYVYHIKAENGKSERFDRHRTIGYVCIGRSNKLNKQSFLQNVRCRQIDPKPTSVNSAWQEKKWWAEKKKWDKI